MMHGCSVIGKLDDGLHRGSVNGNFIYLWNNNEILAHAYCILIIKIKTFKTHGACCTRDNKTASLRI